MSELFLGAMTFGDPDGPGASLDESRRVFDAYADAGGNVVDTAINYRDGASEEYLGELLAGRRDRFVLATKYTVSRDRADPNAAGNHRKNLRLSLETSLRRLRTDHIDVYWAHIWDRNTPLEETMRALDDAVREGKVLYIGISDAPSWVVSRANTLAEWRGWTPFAGLQVPYSLLKRDIETELLPMAEHFGLSVAAWSPLANGILSGKYNTGTATRTRLNPSQVSEHDLAVAKTVGEVADELGATSAQVALAWVRASSPSVHPIIGARTAEQLTDNLGVLNLTLESDVVQRLNDASGFTPGFPSDFIQGTQGFVYGEAGAQVDNRR